MDKFTEDVVMASSTTTLISDKSLFLCLLENIKAEIEELIEYQSYDILHYLKQAERSITSSQKDDKTTQIQNLNLMFYHF